MHQKQIVKMMTRFHEQNLPPGGFTVSIAWAFASCLVRHFVWCRFSPPREVNPLVQNWHTNGWGTLSPWIRMCTCIQHDYGDINSWHSPLKKVGSTWVRRCSLSDTAQYCKYSREQCERGYSLNINLRNPQITHHAVNTYLVVTACFERSWTDRTAVRSLLGVAPIIQQRDRTEHGEPKWILI